MPIICRIFTMERCVKIFAMICLLVPAAAVSGQQTGGGALSCQPTWENNTPVKMTFFIDESKFPSRCTSTDSQPYFQKSTDGSSNTQIECTVSNITAAGACSGSFTPGSLGCGCTAKEGGYYVLEYNFIAHPDYNGWWSASITCLDSSPNQVLSFAKSDCDNKQTQTASGQDKADGVLVCPRKWILGSLVKLTFILDKDRFPSECNFTDRRPVFQMSMNKNLNYRNKCIASDITAAGACTNVFTAGSLGCRCTSKEGGYYVLEYNFIAHPDYNGWWRAGILCKDIDSKNILSFTTVNCNNKTAKTAQSSASNTGNDAKIVILVVGILTFGTSNIANDVKVAALVIGIITFGPRLTKTKSSECPRETARDY